MPLLLTFVGNSWALIVQELRVRKLISKLELLIYVQALLNELLLQPRINSREHPNKPTTINPQLNQNDPSRQRPFIWWALHGVICLWPWQVQGGLLCWRRVRSATWGARSSPLGRNSRWTAALPDRKGKKALSEQGAFIIDSDGDYVTPLVDGRECAYTTFDEDGTAKCGIEQAHRDGAVDFLKPASCHLYPIRITQLANMEALNYHRWPICDPARVCGMDLKLPVFRFLKGPLSRRYGEEWFSLLEETFKVWKEEGRGWKSQQIHRM